MPTLPAERIDQMVAGVARTAFNGQVLEPWGCYLPGNGYRAYNPVLMRFHSPDRWSPFERGGLNPYAYCSGDPVNAVDPTGRWEEKMGPLLALGLNMALFGMASLALRSPAPAMQKGPMLTATYISFSGALIGMYGAVEQLLGNPDGRYISWVGTALSTVSAWARFRIARKPDREDRLNEQIQRMRTRLYKKAGIQSPPLTSRSQAPVPDRTVTPPASPSQGSPIQRSPSPPSRESSASPLSSVPSHVTRSLREGSVLSSTSTRSGQSIVGELRWRNRNIRETRKLSERQYAIGFS